MRPIVHIGFELTDVRLKGSKLGKSKKIEKGKKFRRDMFTVHTHSGCM
jgi:hypothetical protein